MADAGDNSWASSWGAELGLFSYDCHPITQTHQDSSSSWFPSQPYYSYPHNTGSSSYVTNSVPQQQYNDGGDWSGSYHQSKGKEPASYSYNNQKPVQEEPYYSPYTSPTGYSSYFTNPFPQHQENDEFLNLSLSIGTEPAYQKPVYDGFGAASLNNQGLDHVSTQLQLGHDSWTTMQASTDERKDWTDLRLSSHPWSIRKRLQSNEISNNKLLLSKESMRDILPLWDTDSLGRIMGGVEVEVAVWDCDTKSKHQLILKQNRNGKNDRYVLKGRWIKDFVQRRGLKKGDEIGLYWNSIDSRFDFCVFD